MCIQACSGRSTPHWLKKSGRLSGEGFSFDGCLCVYTIKASIEEFQFICEGGITGWGGGLLSVRTYIGVECFKICLQCSVCSQ